MSLLQVSGLEVVFETASGPARAVRGVGFALDRGETLGIVGESGCGKTMTALALMGLLPEGARVTGEVRLDGIDLLAGSEDEWCRVRGNRIAMVFQEPMSSLNPLHTVGRQVAEGLILHRGLGRGGARREARRLLELVGIEDAGRRLDDYPHQLSGGQRQRVMIAMALANEPDILIADEPTTALDVTIQKQILDLVDGLVRELGMGLVLISHDLAVIAHTVERIMVMYGGAVVESAPTRALFGRLSHPYTQGLLSGIPRIDHGDHCGARAHPTAPAVHSRRGAGALRVASGVHVCRSVRPLGGGVPGYATGAGAGRSRACGRMSARGCGPGALAFGDGSLSVLRFSGAACRWLAAPRGPRSSGSVR